MLHFSRRALSMSGLGVVLTGAILVACSDSDPLGPRPPQMESPTPVESYLLECRVDPQARSLSCDQPGGTGSGSGTSQNVMYGGQNQYVTLADDDNFVRTGDTLSFGVSVKNLLPQAIGTEDGKTLHPDGIVVFFGRQPAFPVEVVQEDTAASFTGSEQPYFRYDTILAPNEVSNFKTWKFIQADPSTPFTFGVAIATKVRHPQGWVDASADSVHIPVGGADTVTYLVRKDFVGRLHGNQAVTINFDTAVVNVTRSNDSIFIVGLTKGTATVTLDHADATIDSDTIKVVVNSAPTVGSASYDAIGNKTLSVAAPGLKSLITDGDGAAEASNHSIVAGPVTTSRGGTATLNADGSFTYLNAEDVTGSDTFEFTVTDGLESATGQVTINVGDPVFYVRPGFAGAISNGSDERPFKTLAAAVAKAGDGDTILVLTGTGATAEGGTVTLDPGQVVIGQGHTGAIERSLNGAMVPLLATGGTHPTLGGTLQLAAGAVVRGIHVNASSGAALTGSASATLTEVNLTAADGPAINLTGGTLAASFGNVSSTNPTGSGVILSGVAGSVSAVGGTITGGAGSAFQVSGGSVGVTWGGSITQDAAGALLEVTGNHTGTLTFQNGTLNANGGTGLQFTNADGTYHLNGSLDLSGGDAGIDIGSSSTGTINVTPAAGHSASIVSPSGTAVAVAGGSADLNFSGNVTQGTAGMPLLSVTGSHTGDLVFASGTLNATAGTGLQFSDADGTYNFNGTTTLGGGDAGIDVLAGSGGTINVATATGSSASITNPSGHAVQVSGGAATLAFTYGGTIEKTTAGTGILVQSNAAGASVSFSSAGNKVLTTGASDAIVVQNDLASVTFGGGNLAISTTTGRGLYVQDAGTVQVTGGNNTITTTGAVAVQVVNASSGASGISFRTVNASGAANAIVLNNMPGAGFQIAGTGGAGTGGTLQATNTAVVLSGVDSTRFAGVNVQAPIGFNASTFGGLALETASVTSTNGTALGLTTGRLHVNGGSVSATGGAALSANAVALAGTLSSLSASTTSGNAVSLTNSTGSLTASGGSLAVSGAGGGVAVLVSGNTAGFTYGGRVKQDANAALLSVAGGHSGTLAFNTDSLVANSGTGLQFTDADGVYNFNGSLDLSGGDAGIDIGSGSIGDVNVIPAGGHSAQIVSPTGTAVAIAGGSADLTYNGTVTQATAAQALLSVAGGHSGTVNFASGTLTASNGMGLQFNQANGTYTFTSSTVNLSNSAGGAADAGIDVTGSSTGTFSFGTGTTITNPAAEAIRVASSGPTFTYEGSITKTNGTTGITLSSNSGTILINSVSGTTRTVTTTGTNPAINLSGNTGIVGFGGGNLTVVSDDGNAFSSVGGLGTLTVTGAANTLKSSGGIALNVQNTTIGASGLSFRSIEATGGTNGIFLSNTGTNNGLHVSGTGAAGTGGSITGMTSGADNTTAGIGVYLSNARNIILEDMNLSNFSNYAVYGHTLTYLTLDNVVINGTNGTNSAIDESSISLDNVGGHVIIKSSNISGGFEDNLRIGNDYVLNGGSAQTLDSLAILSSTIGAISTTNGNDAVLVEARDGVTKARIRNSTFTAWRGDAFDMTGRGSAVIDLQFTGNNLDNSYRGSGNDVSGSTNIALGGGGTGSNVTYTYNVSGNSFRNARGATVAVTKGSGTGNFSGTIQNNTFGVSGTVGSASSEGSAISVISVGGGVNTTRIHNNQIHGYNGTQGILLQNGDNTSGGNGTLNATVTSNTIGTRGSFSTFGIFGRIGTTAGDTHTACLTATGNSMTGSGSSRDIRLSVGGTSSSIFRIPGYPATDTGGAVSTYLPPLNGSASAQGSGPANSFQNTAGGAACPLP